MTYLLSIYRTAIDNSLIGLSKDRIKWFLHLYIADAKTKGKTHHAIPLHNLYKFESVPNISIGKEIFKILFPDNKFLPIFFNTSLSTLD